MTPPPAYPHQTAEFELSRDMESRALWWEMGTAKSRPIIDTIAWLYGRGKITAALILAPKAVAPNWARTELPRHLPDDVRPATRILLWRTDKAGTQWYRREVAEALAHDGLLVVCMSYDGIMQGKPGVGQFTGCRTAEKVLTGRDTIMVLDESARIKSPGTKRTKRVQAAGRRAKYRRVLTGTPVANSPFDVFAQIRFLDPDFWARRGCNGFAQFKDRFGEWVRLRRKDGQAYPSLVGYRNLPELYAAVDTVGSRHLKSEVLNLPPKTYERRHFDLTPGQRDVYDTLRKKFMVDLGDGLISAPLAITRILRLQQITSGYCPTDDGDVADLDPGARLDVLQDVLEDVPHQCIVWARFKHDYAVIAERLRKMKRTYVEYVGDTKHTDREQAVDRFQAGDAQVFLASAQCAGEGLTLTAAQTVVYYNTTYKLGDRLQSEDRAHRAGQEHPVTYVDIVAQDTIDEKVLEALKAKKNLADLIMGDPAGGWL